MKKLLQGLTSFIVIAIFLAVLFLLYDRVVPKPSSSNVSAASSSASTHVEEEPHALVLSEQALRNIGINEQTIREITVSSYDKTVSFPAILVDRPGRSAFRIPAPFTGVVKKVHVEPGMVVQPGQILFEIALTHEELIRCQSDLIALCQKRDTIQRELERLESLSTEIAPKAKRDVDIQKMEVDAQIETQRSILTLHGIGEKEILETIERDRKLVNTITIRVPDVVDDEFEREHSADHSESENAQVREVIQMEELFVDKGQLVEPGAPLCRLVDLSHLYIEGRGSSNDESILATALMEHCNVTAIFDGERSEGLRIRYIDTRIDPTSRALRFFVDLPNRVVVQDSEHSHHHPWRPGEVAMPCEMHQHYVNWRFRPGQRCELKIEYDTIPNCIVLPREAVAESGSDAFVFEWTGNEPDGAQRKIWLKRPVHVLHRSKSQIAVANDGSVFPGARVATHGAGQLLVALGTGGAQLQSTCPCGDH